MVTYMKTLCFIVFLLFGLVQGSKILPSFSTEMGVPSDTFTLHTRQLLERYITVWEGTRGGACTWPGVLCDNEGEYVTGIRFMGLEENHPSTFLTKAQGIMSDSSVEIEEREEQQEQQERGGNTAYAEEWSFTSNDCNTLLVMKEVGQWNELTTWKNSTDCCDGTWSGISCNNDKFVSQMWLNDQQLESVPPQIRQLGQLTKLNLANNPLISLPSEIGQLSQLQLLDLSGNRFSEVPLQIWGLKKLTWLDLSFNYLSYISPDIGKLEQLETLHLSNNLLKNVPVQIFDLMHLKTLELAENTLTEIPIDIRNLNKLTQLRLNENQLSTIPAEIGELANLWFLKVSFNMLTSIPVEIFEMPKLSYLDLSGNTLTHIPAKIGQLVQLTDLLLSDNQIKHIPTEIGQISLLKGLSVSNNQLTSLPPDIGQLTHLIGLYVSNNQLTSLPPEIGQLTHLVDLEVSGNALKSVPIEIGQLTHLRHLYVGHNNLTFLPSEVGNLGHLQVLFASNNKLTDVPPDIGNASALIQLELSKNSLTSIPSEIFHLEQLTEIDFSYNQLTSVPPDIRYLRDVREFRLDHNQLAQIPPEISQMVALQDLNLSYNHLARLPDEIGKLQNLEILDVSFNYLESMPSLIGNLGKLIELYASFNYLSSVPSQIGKLEKLNRLEVFGNRLTSIPSALFSLKLLSELNLSRNQLISVPPVTTENLLKSIDLSHNSLSTIPREYGFLSQLTFLDLSYNDITHLPDIRKLQNLRIFDVSHNNMMTTTQWFEFRNFKDFLYLSFQDTSIYYHGGFSDCYADIIQCLPLDLTQGTLVMPEYATGNVQYSCVHPQPSNEEQQEKLSILVDWELYFNHTNCACNRDHYGRHNDCYKCPENGICPGNKFERCVLASRGYWSGENVECKKASEQPIPSCATCQGEEDCNKNRMVRKCRLTHRKICAPSDLDLTDVDTSMSAWKSCASGYTGRLCEDCEDGFYHSGPFCRKCPGEGAKWVLFVVFMGAIIGYVLYLYKMKPGEAGQLKIALFFVQMIQLMVYTGVELPGALSSSSDATSSFSLQIPGAECYNSGWNYKSRFTVLMLMPLMVVCGTALVFGVGLVAGKLQGGMQWHGWARRNARVCLMLLLTAYFPVATTVLHTLPTETDQCEGVEYFAKVPWVQYEGSLQHTAIGMVFLYVLGIPLIVGTVCYVYRQQRTEEKTASVLGFLYGTYTDQYWWWEAMVLVRRLMIAILLSLLPYEGTVAPLLVFAVLLASYGLQQTVQPFITHIDNVLEQLTLAILCINYGVIVAFADEDFPSQAVGVGLVVLDAGVVGVLLWQIFKVHASKVTKVVGKMTKSVRTRKPRVELELENQKYMALEG